MHAPMNYNYFSAPQQNPYYGGAGGRRPLPDPDDEYGEDQLDFPVFKGDLIGGRYEIVKVMGSGSFGKVVECVDRATSKKVAVKMSKLARDCIEEFNNEIDVMENIAANDPEGKFACARMVEWFKFQGHLCMVFPKYGLSLYHVLKKNKFRPFPIEAIRCIARQLFKTFAFLHSLGWTHADVKPENVLFADELTVEADGRINVPHNPRIVLIDFGSTTHNKDRHDPEIGTACYQSPEMLLNLGWSYPIDVFGTALLLLELYTGTTTFKIRSDEKLEQLAMMQRLIGPLPRHMAIKAGIPPAECAMIVAPGPSLRHLIHASDMALYEFLMSCLEMDPAFRITPQAALGHAFVLNALKPAAPGQQPVGVPVSAHHNKHSSGSQHSSNSASSASSSANSAAQAPVAEPRTTAGGYAAAASSSSNSHSNSNTISSSSSAAASTYGRPMVNEPRTTIGNKIITSSSHSHHQTTAAASASASSSSSASTSATASHIHNSTAAQVSAPAIPPAGTALGHAVSATIISSSLGPTGSSSSTSSSSSSASASMPPPPPRNMQASAAAATAAAVPSNANNQGRVPITGGMARSSSVDDFRHHHYGQNGMQRKASVDLGRNTGFNPNIVVAQPLGRPATSNSQQGTVVEPTTSAGSASRPLASYMVAEPRTADPRRSVPQQQQQQSQQQPSQNSTNYPPGNVHYYNKQQNVQGRAPVAEPRTVNPSSSSSSHQNQNQNQNQGYPGSNQRSGASAPLEPKTYNGRQEPIQQQQQAQPQQQSQPHHHQQQQQQQQGGIKVLVGSSSDMPRADTAPEHHPHHAFVGNKENGVARPRQANWPGAKAQGSAVPAAEPISTRNGQYSLLNGGFVQGSSSIRNV